MRHAAFVGARSFLVSLFCMWLLSSYSFAEIYVRVWLVIQLPTT
jgi:hypothetical protein